MRRSSKKPPPPVESVDSDGPWPAPARAWLPDMVAGRRWPVRWIVGLGCLVGAVVLVIPVVR